LTAPGDSGLNFLGQVPPGLNDARNLSEGKAQKTANPRFSRFGGTKKKTKARRVSRW